MGRAAAGKTSGGPPSLFITNDFPPRIGGAQSYYWSLIQTLDPDEVTILAPNHRDAAAFDRTHPYRVVRWRFSQLLPTPGLLNLAADLVYENDARLVQLGHPLPNGLLGPWLKQRLNLPYLVFILGAEVTLPAALPGSGQALRHVLRHASLLISVSRYTAEQAAKQVRGEVPVRVLRAPVDLERFSAPASEAEVDALRSRLGIDGQLVVCVGRLVPRKGQDRLLDALVLLRREFPRLHLALIGGGRLEASLKRRALRWGMSDRVHILGKLGPEEVRAWLQAADLFASPCRTRWGGLEIEGYGIVYAEAALTGLPVMAGRCGGSVEAVREGDTGILVDGASASEVAEGLARLLCLSQDRRRRLGAAGRAFALERHDPQRVGREYRRLLSLAAGV